jgi:hypothetical protein
MKARGRRGLRMLPHVADAVHSARLLWSCPLCGPAFISHDQSRTSSFSAQHKRSCAPLHSRTLSGPLSLSEVRRCLNDCSTDPLPWHSNGRVGCWRNAFAISPTWPSKAWVATVCRSGPTSALLSVRDPRCPGTTSPSGCRASHGHHQPRSRP